ncbi:biotin biosynthesis protein BioY [Bifidobacterium pseudolongum subsp. globosum]|uniref:Biotin biosynthesis protein BioY n=1 Tax=Bifidobacterium pseudolongum subsp. globosum TaxID=1690 RepID=A0A4Q5A1V7_9BIFI|nr:biotin transporter BioY [Bifidobacterium pseudolongum]RYQ11641.1 biotin biosynthesis protein BioY [Bifidobacterium pseudolongum subsp. globosum]
MQNTEITTSSRLTMRTFMLQWAPSVVAAGLLWAATAAGRIPIPGTPVPITLQTLVVMMAAMVLSRRQAVAAVVMYVAMGACGLPVFAGGMSTLALVGPSAGFIFGFVPAVAVTATLAAAVQRVSARWAHLCSDHAGSGVPTVEDGAGVRVMHRPAMDGTNEAAPYTRAWRATMHWALRFAAYWMAAVIGCIVLHYACGLLVQTAVTGVPLRLIASASAGFLPGDLCKAALAATVAATFRR